MTILKFSYCYCDAAGYKKHGDTQILNTSGLRPEEATNELLPFLHDGEFFIARQVIIPEVFLEELPTNADHCWHSFSGITEGETDESPSLSAERSWQHMRHGEKDG